MNFCFSKHGEETLEQLEKVEIRRILKKLQFWSEAPQPLLFAKPIVGRPNLFRFRVGDYRVIVFYNSTSDSLDILKVGHRSTIYKKMD